MKNETPAVLPYSYYPLSLAIAREKPQPSRLVVASRQLNEKKRYRDVNDPANWDTAWFAHYE